MAKFNYQLISARRLTPFPAIRPRGMTESESIPAKHARCRLNRLSLPLALCHHRSAPSPFTSTYTSTTSHTTSGSMEEIGIDLKLEVCCSNQVVS